jgi:hypothetical protein
MSDSIFGTKFLVFNNNPPVIMFLYEPAPKSGTERIGNQVAIFFGVFFVHPSGKDAVQFIGIQFATTAILQAEVLCERQIRVQPDFLVLSKRCNGLGCWLDNLCNDFDSFIFGFDRSVLFGDLD